jgi:hypothetical protein
MRLTSHRLDALPDDPSAAALLGSDHPLVRAVDCFSIRVQQSLAVAALLSGSSIALVAGVSAALSFVVAAALYGEDVRLLQEELHRIRFLLEN